MQFDCDLIRCNWSQSVGQVKLMRMSYAIHFWLYVILPVVASSVARFWYWGKTHKCTDKTNKIMYMYNFYAWVSEGSELLRNTHVYFQVSKYLIHHANIYNQCSSLLYIKFRTFHFFSQTRKSMSPYQNISEQTLFCIYSEWIYGKFYFFIAEIHGKLWGDDIINSLICTFISTVQELFWWKLCKFKISHLAYFLSDLLKIFTVLF